MGTLTVRIKTRMYNSYYSSERYGDWSEDSSYEGCEVFLGDAGGEIGYFTNSAEVPFEPVAGQVVFPVIVVYSSGNTFGRSTGETALVGVYETPEKAQKVAGAVRANADQANSEYSIEVGGEQIYCGAWTGYFEYLEDIRIETEMVKA